MDEQQKDLLFKLSMSEQNIKLLQQQLQAIEEAIIDMNSINFGLDEIKGSVGKEILAPIGRGIFVKAKLISEDLTVDVGGKNFVKRNVSETKEIIRRQFEKLDRIKKDLENGIKEIDEELTTMILEAQKKGFGNIGDMDSVDFEKLKEDED